VIAVSDTILLGRGRQILEIPRQMWEQHLAQAPQHVKGRLRFMSEDHHRVRYFVVRELPRIGAPIEPGIIAQRLQIAPQRVADILNDLEQNLFFLVRNPAGAVTWAFPVTSQPTPHRLSFSTGEQLYAA
jgi:hypothetical protein